jgi:hypothetical protein
MSEPFVPEDFAVPVSLECEPFRLEPLSIAHNERDHLAWSSSIEHIRNTPGFPMDAWPHPMSADENLKDLQRHSDDFAQRRGFTYTVLDKDEVIGCVYLYPSDIDGYDVDVRSWVTGSRSDLDPVLWHTVTSWLAEAWPFECVQYDSR